MCWPCDGPYYVDLKYSATKCGVKKNSFFLNSSIVPLFQISCTLNILKTESKTIVSLLDDKIEEL